ncbi:hypothetical protein ACFPN2_25095 [Steroidobacter flavus]|uniref:Uncharacterized protein n=1 Tax=Steroidobacter flavus TaxID=1842136 RepID=A0ABV8T198_9GAMM
MELLPLDDPRWAAYRRGYNRVPFDVVSLIRRLQQEGTSDKFWELVWDELHHQGDVGEASYALVPYLVEYQSRQRDLDEQLFHYCVVIDLAHPENNNPPIPPELEISYAKALRKLPVIGADLLRRGCGEAVVMGVAAATALAAGHRVLARAYLDFGRSDALEYLRSLNGYEPGPDD